MQQTPGAQGESYPSSNMEAVPRLGPEPLQLIIARPPEINTCPFWLSHYRRGTASTRNLLQCENLEEFFRILNNEGLSETKPLMLSDNTLGKQPRQFYIFPELTNPEQSDEIRKLVTKTLEALKPEKVGLYFGPDTAGKEICLQLIEEIAVDASFLRTKELFFYTGEVGVNTLLNAALRVKHRLEGRRDVFVYH